MDSPKDTADLLYPLVTVVVLCYNQGQYVRQALDSVLAQDYPNLQLIVIDDGSTDGSQAVIADWAAEHPSVKQAFLLPHNIGMTKAFMQAFDVISGQYLVDLSADDVMQPSRISIQVKAFTTLPQSIGLVYTDAIVVNQDLVTIRKWYTGRPLLLKETAPHDLVSMLLSHNHICTPTVMYKVSAWRQVGGFDENYTYEDLPIFLKLALAGYDFACINEPLTLRRTVPKSATNRQFVRGRINSTLTSTAALCQWLLPQLKGREQQLAFGHFVRYHFRLSALLGHQQLSKSFLALLEAMGAKTLPDSILTLVTNIPLPWHLLLRK